MGLILLLVSGCADRPQTHSSDIAAVPADIDCVDVHERLLLPGTNIRLTQQHCKDWMGPDEQGLYVYFYEYDTYVFSDGNSKLSARSYIDDDSEAHFLRIEQAGTERFLQCSDFDLPFVSSAMSYLLQNGKTSLTFLDSENHKGGYSPVPKSIGVGSDGA